MEVAMFEVLFGTVWTIFTAFMTFAWISSEGKFLVSDSIGLRYKFTVLGGQMCFFGIFWLVGLTILCIGVKKLIRNANTNKFGEECFGVVCNIYNSGTYMNDAPELKSDVLVYIPSLNETKVISEVVGVGQSEYEVGSYVRLKYYNDDINLEGIVDEDELPSATKLILEKSPEFNNKTINNNFVNRDKYTKKDNEEYDYNDYNEDYEENDDGPINYM